MSAYIELCREFYTIFEFKLTANYNLGSPGIINFRLLGHAFYFSITAFNTVMGFISEEDSSSEEYLTSLCDFEESFDALTES